MSFENIGVMFDCSRNAVAKPETIKKLIGIMSDLGYTFAMMYTEDTYPLKNQPYFGYLRGGYTRAEIKEIDDYAKSRGIELIPCVQTLSHLSNLSKRKPYSEFMENESTLLIDDEKTYEFIESIFQNLSETFTSKKVHIGMDEAFGIGLGLHLRKYGYENRYALFARHLKRVAEIAEKYGFKPMIWSDMIFSLLGAGSYYSNVTDIDNTETDLVPKNIDLVYWDYYGTDVEKHAKVLKLHKKFGCNVYYAGGALNWTGFVPGNILSMQANEAGVKACKKSGVKNAFITIWGDDGKESSFFSVLPTIYAFSRYVKGEFEKEKTEQGFFEYFNIRLDDFLLLDSLNKPGKEEAIFNNPHKYFLFNDLLSGSFDCFVRKGMGEKYAEKAKALKKAAAYTGEYRYIFDCIATLAEVLSIKTELGVDLRLAYRAKNKSKIFSITEQLSVLSEKAEKFYTEFKALWMKENKPYGFEIHAIKLGGLIRRIADVKERLEEYLAGISLRIPELEDEILPFWGNQTDCEEQTMLTQWCRMVTENYL